MGRRAIALNLNEDELATLESWVRGRKTPAAEKLRAQIVLACAQGESGERISARLSVSDRQSPNGGAASLSTGSPD